MGLWKGAEPRTRKKLNFEYLIAIFYLTYNMHVVGCLQISNDYDDRLKHIYLLEKSKSKIGKVQIIYVK